MLLISGNKEYKIEKFFYNKKIKKKKPCFNRFYFIAYSNFNCNKKVQCNCFVNSKFR